jgi:PAS domain S-box-containing protein
MRWRPGAAQKQLFALIVETAADGLSLHDLEGRYVYASPSFEDLLGWPPDELIGRDAYELIHPDDVRDVGVSHETVVDASEPFTVRYRLRHADDTYRWMESTSQVVAGHDLIVVVTRPIERREPLTQALEHERHVAQRLRELDRQRVEFLTTVAHRARQPLTVILGTATVLPSLIDIGNSHDAKQLIDRLLANAERLSDLVEQVTQAEKLSRKAAELRLEPIDVRALAIELADNYSAADARLDIDVERPRLVHADRALLVMALRALLDNAVTHTPAGTRIWVRTETTGQGTVIVLEDDGRGVPDAHKEQIFEAFESEPDQGQPDPGLGIGLYLVAEIAAVHGGRAWVEDRPGGGASFRFQLPAPATH